MNFKAPLLQAGFLFLNQYTNSAELCDYLVHFALDLLFAGF